MTILLFGADGQLGFELHRVCSPLGDVTPFTATGKLPGGLSCEKLDFTEQGALAKAIRSNKPRWVLNAVAYTAVDRAEDEPALAQRINGDAVAEIAEACKSVGAKCIHYSTDYVFNGKNTRPWREDDAPGPVNVYGKTKLAGEDALRDSGCDHMILRTAWVYGARGANFMRTALRLAADRPSVRIVNDQIGSPTPSRWLANATVNALAKRPDAQGIWHVVANGQCSWAEFASAIYGDALVAGVIARAPKVEGIPSSEYPTKAVRPSYSRLDTSKLSKDFGIQLPDWRDGLRQIIGELAESRIPF
jgi:dTDP-4-dehydrorhamnose reductase